MPVEQQQAADNVQLEATMVYPQTEGALALSFPRSAQPRRLTVVKRRPPADAIAAAPPRDACPQSAIVEQRPTASVILQTLYDSYATAVYKFIFRKVGNREDAEDLTSQVFLKAAQNLDTERDSQSMLAWLYQVARTTIADHWRAHYQAGTLSMDELEEDQGLQCVAQAQRSAASAPAEAQVAALLAALPENYRRVLELRFLQGYSLRETAAAMGITEGNVKVLQYRAVQKAGK